MEGSRRLSRPLVVHNSGFSPVHGENDARVSSYERASIRVAYEGNVGGKDTATKRTEMCLQGFLDGSI
jgi:hypothetical protein